MLDKETLKILESGRPGKNDPLLEPFTWHDVDFREGDIEGDGCERLYVIVKGVEIPVYAINLKAQQTRLGLIQLHIFIDKMYQKLGIATKVYNAFIHQFGGIYSGYKRVMNLGAILAIYAKLAQEPDISVSCVYGIDKEPIGIQAVLKK